MKSCAKSLERILRQLWHVVPDNEIFVTGDNAWLCAMLGMEDVPLRWCVHCVLEKKGVGGE